MSRTPDILATVSIVLLLMLSWSAPLMAQGDHIGVAGGRDGGDRETRTFNNTEYPRYFLTPPVIDGVLSPGEWSAASFFNIGTAGKTVHLYLAYNDTRFYMGIDAISDTTNDLEGPDGSGPIVISGSDYFIATLDGENDGKITYTNVWDAPNNRDWVGEWPPTEGGVCVDRAAAASGNSYFVLGWWGIRSTGTGVTLWIEPRFGGPNNGLAEPFDFINLSFTNNHRMYEYSIPFNGTGDELLRHKGEAFGFTLVVNDKGSGTIGRFPTNGTGNGAPYLAVNLSSKPRAAANVTTSPMFQGPPRIFAKGTALSFDSIGSGDDGTISNYAWNFEDGSPDQTGPTNTTATHSFAAPGYYNVTLTVRDNDNIPDMAEVPVHIIELPALPAISNVTPVAGQLTVNETASMDFSISYDDLNLRAGAPVGDMLNITWYQDGVVKKTETGKTAAGTSTFRFDTSYDGPNSHKATPYVVNATVTDLYDFMNIQKTHNVSAQWSVSVAEKNRPPVVTKLSPTSEDTIIAEGQQQDFNISMSDPDNDALSVTWYVNGMEVTSAKNQVGLTVPATAGYNTSGIYAIIARVKDSGVPSYSADLVWNLTVTNVNQGPVLEGHTPDTGTPTVKEGELLKLSIAAIDPDDDQLTYTWALNGVTITDQDGPSFDYMPGYKDSRLGHVRIMVDVSDGDPLIDQPSFEWSVAIEDSDRLTQVSVTSPWTTVFRLSENVTFDASSTTDADMDPKDGKADLLDFTWDFGDGTTREGPTVTHIYKSPGTYAASLTVKTTHEGKLVTTEGWGSVLTVQAAELSVVTVSGSTASVKEDESVFINVTIENKGSLDAKGVKVTVLMDKSTTALVKDVDIKAGGTAVLTFEWKARVGTHTFTADVVGDKDTVVRSKYAMSPAITVKKKGTNNPPIGTGTFASGGIAMWIFIIVAILVVVVVLWAVTFSAKKRRGQKDLEERIKKEQEALRRAEDDRKVAIEDARQKAFEIAAARAEMSSQSTTMAAAKAAAEEAALDQLIAEVANPDSTIAPTPFRTPLKPVRKAPLFKVPVKPKEPDAEARPPAFRAPPEERSYLVPEQAPEPEPVPDQAVRQAAFAPPKGIKKAWEAEAKPSGPKFEACPQCGGEIEPDWVKCPECGKALK